MKQQEAKQTTESKEVGLFRRPLTFTTISSLLIGSLLVIGGVSVAWYRYHADRVSPPALISEVRGSSLTNSNQAPFDLDHSLIPEEEIMRGGPAKDQIPSLTEPSMLSAQKAEYLNPDDRVVGVAFNGEAAAYPIRILNWHEAVNDEVGGKAILATYCPLCDSALVFDRRIDGEIREFGISGLLYQSNVLLYDRQEPGNDESLWSQMLLKAVTGPAAEKGLELDLLPATLTTWEKWKTAHPGTQVLSKDTGYTRDYDRNPYESYFQTERTMFPVKFDREKLGGLSAKSRTVMIKRENGWWIYPITILSDAAENNRVEHTVMGETLLFDVDSENNVVTVTNSEGETQPSAYSLLFEAIAMHPDANLYRAE